MRVQIEHREVQSIFGRKHFFVDTKVQFSEAEKAVIRNRQLGDHFIEVGGDVPRFRSVGAYTAVNIALRLVFILTAVMIIPAGFLLDYYGIRGSWWFVLIFVCIASYVYRKILERNFKKSYERRQISLSNLMKKPKFSVFEPDAYLAQETEKGIVAQLNDLKNRMIAVAPGLAEKQVYANEP